MLKSETSYFDNIFRIGDLNIVNIHILLWGKDKLSKTVTDHMFSLVYIFVEIKKILITCLHLHQNALSDTL